MGGIPKMCQRLGEALGIRENWTAAPPAYNFKEL